MLIVYPNSNSFTQFFGASLTSIPNVQAIGYFKSNSRILLFFVKLLIVLNLPIPHIFFGAWKTKKNIDTLILFDEVANEKSISTLARNSPNARKILYLWNKHTVDYILNAAKKYDYEIWTFDKEISEKYSFHYNPQFYPFKQINTLPPPKIQGGVPTPRCLLVWI